MTTPTPTRHRYGVTTADGDAAFVLADPELAVDVRRVDPAGETRVVLARRDGRAVVARYDAAGHDVETDPQDELSALDGVLDLVRGDHDHDAVEERHEQVSEAELTGLRETVLTSDLAAAPPGLRALAFPAAAVEVTSLERVVGIGGVSSTVLTTLHWVEGADGDLWLVDTGTPGSWELRTVSAADLFDIVYAHLGDLR